MTTVAEITARDWSPKLGSFGAVVTSVADIAQCLRIIFTTPIGSVPLRRSFGSRIHRSIDKPFPVAQANIPLDVLEAAQWEPRAVIRSVKVSQAEVMYGLAVGIEWAESGNTAASQILTLSGVDFSATPEAQRIITTEIAQAAIAAEVNITDYSDEFLAALND